MIDMEPEGGLIMSYMNLEKLTGLTGTQNNL